MTGQYLERFLRGYADLDIITNTRGGIIASVITFPALKDFVGHPSRYASLSGAIVSTFTGGCFFGAVLGGW